MPKKFNIGWLLFLALALTAAPLCHADTRDAELVKQGTDALKRKDYDTAIARLSDAIRLPPDDAEAWSARGEAHAHKGDSAPALLDCAESLKLAPGSSKVYRRCGNVHYIARDYRSAITNYDVAIQLDPHSAVTYLDRGIAYSRLEQTDRSIADYDEALKLDPSQSNAHAWRGYAWWQKGDFDRAWDDFNRAIEEDPKNAFAFFSRGYAAASRYDYDDAIADYNKAINLDPTYKDAYQYRDEALQHKGDIWWGKIYLLLMGIGVLAILFAAIRTYLSPNSFSHGVERHFKRMPDGRLVFYPKMKGVGYVVPDVERERTLRAFARRARAVSLILGIVVIGLSFALLPVIGPLNSWLTARSGLSMWTIIALTSSVEVIVIMASFFVGFSVWRRATIRGLTEAAEPGESPPPNQWNNDFVQDMPVAVRWIVLAVMLFVVFQSFKALWRIGYHLSVSGVGSVSLISWMDLVGCILMLWYCGRLLIYAIRERGRHARSSEKPA